MGSEVKVCLLCKTDCSNRPRTKDAQGRYVCQECLAKRTAKKPAAAAVAGSATTTAVDDDVLGKMLDDVKASRANACSQCGSPMAGNAVVCVRCGFNAKTGKRMLTEVGVAGGDEPDTAKKTQANTYDEKRAKAKRDLAAVPALMLAGGAVGAAIGAAIWAMVYSSIGLDGRFLAVLVGIMAGTGAAAGAKGYAGTVSGIYAVAVTLLSIAIAKSTVIHPMVRAVTQAIDEEVTDITVDDAKMHLADEVMAEFDANGTPYHWRPGISRGVIISIEQFPVAVKDEAKKRWAQMGEGGQKLYMRRLQDEQDALKEAVINTIHEESKERAKDKAFTVRAMLGYFMAIGAAFGIGSGGKLID